MSAISTAAAEAYRALCRLEDELDAAWSQRAVMTDIELRNLDEVRSRWRDETSRKMTRAVKTKARK